MRKVREHDALGFQILEGCQLQVKTRGANKEKPEKPGVEGKHNVLLHTRRGTRPL